MDPVTVGILGLVGTFVLILLHVPIGVAMGVTGLLGYAAVVGWGPALSLAANEPASVISSADLAVIPLFLLMGELAARAGLAGDVYNLASAFVGHRRGGLALATVGGCAAFGAVCGSGIATAATFGRVALPEMMRRGYAPSLATGSVASGGTLGIIIPPSVVMVIYAALTEQFVSDLFIAAIVPGLLAVAGYAIAVLVYARLFPEGAPAVARSTWAERWTALRRSWGVFVLMLTVIGGIYAGVFTVNEAAAVGVVLALGFAVARRALTRASLVEVLLEAAAASVMVYVMIFGASIFSYLMTVTRLPDHAVAAITALEAPAPLVVGALLVFFILLGAVFDEVATMVLTLPFVVPLVTGLGYDLVWWGIINVIVIEIGMICPPIGINVFVLHGMNRNVPLAAIYRGIMPFLIADFARLAALTAWPALTLTTLRLVKG